MQSTISYDSDTGDSGNAIWTTTFTYNGLGQLTKTQINDGQPRTVTFTLDETGQIIRRDETRPSNAPAAQTGSPHELWYRFGAGEFGREIGYIGNNGGEDPTTVGSYDDLRKAPDRLVRVADGIGNAHRPPTGAEAKGAGPGKGVK